MPLKFSFALCMVNIDYSLLHPFCNRLLLYFGLDMDVGWVCAVCSKALLGSLSAFYAIQIKSWAEITEAKVLL